MSPLILLALATASANSPSVNPAAVKEAKPTRQEQLEKVPVTSYRGVIDKKGQEDAEKRVWDWDFEKALAAYCVDHLGGDYQMRAVPSGIQFNQVPAIDTPFRFTLTKRGRELYAWTGFDRTTFQVDRDTLYYLEIDRNGRRGTVIAYDLAAKHFLFRTKLPVYEDPRLFMRFDNRTIFGYHQLAVQGQYLVVAVRGTARHYICLLDPRNGEIVGLKVFWERAR